MSALGEALRALAGVLEAHGAPWYVFGAQAVTVHGAPRATQDLDVTVTLPPTAGAALMVSLRAAGFLHRFPELEDELLRDGSVLPLVHVASGFDVDLILGGEGLEALTASRARRAGIDGVVVPVATATDLAVMKVLAGRGKDLDDVRALLAGGGVNVSEVRDLLAALEAALAQSDLLPTFERLVAER